MSLAIETEGLTRYFGKQKAVDRIDLKVEKGEVYGFLGLNGAGKTTTIRMLIRLFRADQGNIKIFGMDLNKKYQEILKKVGALIEFPGFYSQLSGYENLKIFQQLLKVKDKKKINEVLSLVGLEEAKNKKAGKYSLGMKQRLALARILLRDPQLLILDEPTNGLDPSGIIEMRQLIRKLSIEKGITIFLSSHLLSEVQQIADRIGIIHQGKLLTQLTMTELKKKNKKHLKIEVSQPEAAVGLLKNKLKINNCRMEENKSISIFGGKDFFLEEKKESYFSTLDPADAYAAKINELLILNKIPVHHLSVETDNLEEYFLSLTEDENIYNRFNRNQI